MSSVRRRSTLSGVVAFALVASLACQRVESTPNPPTIQSTGERVTIGEIQWYVDYDAAVAIAREQDKALWVHFGENPG